MRNRSRLDLICVPQGVDTVLPHDRWPAVQQQWRAAGLLGPRNSPTPALVEGGGEGVLVDVPETRVVYANQLGGFRVQCPACGGGVARSFAAAMEQSRAGGEIRVMCPSCNTVHGLASLRTRPSIRVGRSALILVDVGGSRLTESGARAVQDWLGPYTLVLRRVS